MSALTCLIGMLALLVLALVLSLDRRAINWRTVGAALLLQTALGAFVLYIPVGQSLLAAVTSAVSSVLEYAQDGIDFVFGDVGSGKLGFVFAFQVLPAIIFFSSLISVLYYFGVMQWIVRILGGALSKLLGTSAPESLAAATNIFIGQTEAPIAIRPFLGNMTRSELFAVMVGGLATVAGAPMAGYVAIGVELKYLIAASFMAAPGALAMAKLLVPEDPQASLQMDLSGLKDNSDEEAPVNVFDAAARGATSGLMLAANVGAMLVAFIALIALANGGLGWIGALFGAPQLSFELLLGYIFSPFAWLLGIPWSEAVAAGSFIGQKLILNEFVAYVNFMQDGAALSEHTRAVITFALCGFA
ncbi:MAG: nucleoside transporter C-terminal domain-containing protein, partial [Pseudomonadota bacterium]